MKPNYKYVYWLINWKEFEGQTNSNINKVFVVSTNRLSRSKERWTKKKKEGKNWKFI